MSMQELLAKLKTEYINDLPSRIQEIQQFIGSKDIPALNTCFHKLKGSGKTYGVPEISTISEILERLTESAPDKIIENHNVIIDLLIGIQSKYKDGSPVELESDQRYVLLKKSLS